MIVHAGKQIIEFQSAAAANPLSFDRAEDASTWLTGLSRHDPHIMHRLREYLARCSGEAVCRLSDHETVQHLTVLLHSRRVIVTARQMPERKGSSGPPMAVDDPAAGGGATATADDPQLLARLWIRLDLTAKQAAKETGNLRLIGSTGYDQTLAIAGSFVPNVVEAKTVDVLFEDVPTKATYSLTYLAEDGSTVTLVEGAPFNSLRDESMDPPATETQP
jgi:hypothetical protein